MQTRKKPSPGFSPANSTRARVDISDASAASTSTEEPENRNNHDHPEDRMDDDSKNGRYCDDDDCQNDVEKHERVFPFHPIRQTRPRG